MSWFSPFTRIRVAIYDPETGTTEEISAMTDLPEDEIPQGKPQPPEGVDDASDNDADIEDDEEETPEKQDQQTG